MSIKETISPNQMRQIMLELSNKTKKIFAQKNSVELLNQTVLSLRSRVTSLENRVAELEAKVNTEEPSDNDEPNS